MQDAILGLDIGTSAIKAVLYDTEGHKLHVEQRAYPLLTPRPGWVELDGERLWEATVDAMATIARTVAAHTRIVALALAVPAGCIVPVDKGGLPVAPIITWLDRRGEPLAAAWEADGTAAWIHRRSGWRPQVGMPFTAISWLVRHAPDVAATTARYAGIHDYLVGRLTGQPVTDLSAGAETALIDLATATWSDELCAVAGIHCAQLPGLVEAGTPVGRLLPAVCAITQLPEDTVVVAGGHDQCCAALGMGIKQTGQVMLASGTAWVITALTGALTVDHIPGKMDLNFHVVPGVRTASRLLGGFGASVEWWLNVAHAPTAAVGEITRKQQFAELDGDLASSRPGANDLLFLPLGGSLQLDGGSTQGGFIGLRLDHTRADMARAILEGAAYEVRWALESLAATDQPIDRLWMSGGAVRSPVWPQILADVTGVPLWVAGSDNWPARGAALLAASGCGLYSSLAAAEERWRPLLRCAEPELATAALYTERYLAYRSFTSRLADR